eukprot:9682568-Alexandrium_andersonii.AAC.1
MRGGLYEPLLESTRPRRTIAPADELVRRSAAARRRRRRHTAGNGDGMLDLGSISGLVSGGCRMP